MLPFDQFDPFTQWPRSGQVFVPNLRAVQTQVQSWVELAQRRVSREMQLVLQPDALRTLSEAFDPTSNAYKVSAREAIRLVRRFLQDRAPTRFEGSTFKRLYADTIERLSSVEKELDWISGGGSPVPAPNPDGDAPVALTPEQQALSDIYTVSGLQFGTIFLRGRLEMAMRLALRELFDRLPADQQNVAAQVLASDRFLEVLQRVSGTDNLAVILADIQGSKPVTQDTLQSFADLFDRNIRGTLKHYQRQETELGGSTGGTYRRVRAQLCLNLLAVPSWPKGVPARLCDGLRLDPIIVGGPSSIEVNAGWISAPHDKRACAYRDYLRLSKIYQDWRPASGF